MPEDESPLETRVHAAQQRVHEIKRRRRRSALLIRAFLLLAILGGGAAVYLYAVESPDLELSPRRQEPPPVAQTQPEPVAQPPAPEPVAAPAPAPEPESEKQPVALPPLADSDAYVRELGGELSTRPELDQWLLADDLIWRFAISVTNVAEGTSPRHQLSLLAPPGEFKAAVSEGRVTVDPSSYARYDTLVDVFTSLHTRATVRLYRRLRPLIDEAYAQLGFPDESFDATAMRAIHELLLTPRIEGEVELTPGILSYEYLDPRLEALSPAQKQLLRTGPRNVARVQTKLRELAVELGISPDELPETIVYRAESS